MNFDSFREWRDPKSSEIDLSLCAQTMDALEETCKEFEETVCTAIDSIVSARCKIKKWQVQALRALLRDYDFKSYNWYALVRRVKDILAVYDVEEESDELEEQEPTEKSVYHDRIQALLYP